MLKLLTMLQKKLVWAIPVAMMGGLLPGYLADASALKALILPVTFVMVFPMMVTLNVKSVFRGKSVCGGGGGSSGPDGTVGC